MRPVFARLLAVAGLLVAAAVPAQDYRYHLYVDRDVNAATGCTVVHGPTTVSGVEARLTAEVTGTTVTLVSGADCSGGSFGATSVVGGPHPVGLNNGTAGADVVELSAPRSLFGSAGVVRVAVVAENAAATTSDGLTSLPGGAPILLGLVQVAIPTLGFAGLLLLIAAVFVVARRRLRLGMATLGALLMAGAVWAANFISDGAVGDWAGVTELASDPTGDGSGPDVGADIVALFAAEENGRVFARIDVVDVENQAPVAVSQAQTWLEDSPAQTITLTATDGDGDPLTFAIQTPPTRGVLGAIVPIDATSASVSYTPNANEFGADSFSFVANDGLTNSAPATVAITLTPVNDVPAFTAGANVTVLKDTGAQTINPWATGISAGPANESAQTLTFTITANDNPGMFAVVPSVAANGALSFTTAANANGSANLSVRVQDNGGTANGGVDTSATQNFSINLTAVNDAPSFTKGGDQTVLEDAGAQTVNPWATAISAGPPDEAGQTLTFNITGNTNAALFSAGPAVSPAGALTYAPAANANGSATITLTLSDNGGTANGGIDTSAPQTFVINVTAVNDVPAFTAGANVTVLKDTGAQTINPWATGISAGPANESAQTLTFTITANDNPGMFAVVPAVAANGALSFTTAANANGTANLSVRVQDNGGTANGGVDTSATQNFSISLTAVNDAPSFTKGGDQTVLEDAGAQTVNPWATAISAGPPDEAGQTLTFNVTGNTNAALFSAGPAVSPAGALTYTPAANANGSATITLTLSDNGGTANGGIDTSAPQTFVINVTAVNDAPVQTLPAGPLSIATGATLAIAGISVADVDAAAGPLQTTLNVAPLGTLSATASGGAGVVGNGTSTLTITSALTGLNATLATLQFSSASGGNTTQSMTTSDQGNTGSGGAQSDGPDTLAITIDKGPEVTSVNPVSGATGVLIGSNVVVTFDEAVTVAGNWAQLVCTTSGTRSVGAGTLAVTDADPVFTLNPTVDLTAGETCTLTVFAAQVTDDDVIDPPNTMPADFSSNFVTEDLAPRITGTTPVAAAVVNQNQTLTLNFSESVNVAAGAITWNCGGAVAFTPALPQNGVSSLVLTPSAPLSAGAACTVAVESTLVTDVDAVDPPNELDGNGDNDVTDGDADDFALAFSVDAAPAFSNSTPANGDLNVSPSTNIVVNFSESVNATAASFTIDCGAGDLGEVVGGSGSASITLDPIADLAGGASCTVTAVPAQIDDSDAIDPPANPAAFAFSFTTASLAADDSYSVTPQLTLAANSGTQGDVDANDQLGSGAITGFGATLGTANGTAPNGTNFITAGGSGGRVVLAADGSFSFFPDAGDVAPATATFFYTVTGGDTAVVTLTFAAGELVWFVDDNAVGTTCTGSNVGAQACPSTTFAAIASADTAGDTLYFADGNHSVTAVLVNNERVIGQASTQSLAAFTGITPVSGSAFPALGGAAPVLSSAGVVLTLDATAGNQHRLRGFNIGDAGTDIAGTGFGTLDVAEVALTGTGMALNLNNGTLAGGFNGVSSTASAAQGLALQNISASGTFSFGGTSISGSTTQGLLVSNSPANLDFGATVVNLAGGTDAISLQSSSAGGTRSFSSVAVTNGGGVGLLLFNAGNVSIGGGSIATTNRAAIDASGTNALNITLTSVSSTNSTGKGINIDAATGTLSIGGGAISGSATEAFDLNAGSAVISYAGTVTKTSAGRLVDISGRSAGNVTLSGNLSCTSPCTGINVASNSGGTIAFSAATKTLNTGTSNAVTLATNTGATINFSGGGLDIDTTSGVGFSASGGGTVSVQGTGNSIASSTGTALSVASTTIGASGLIFQSISANGAANGIVLNATGASGGLTVTGTGGAGTGGTIQNVTNNAISLTATRDASFSRMVISNTGAPAVFGTGVVNFALTDSSLSNIANADNENAIDFGTLAVQNITGVLTLTNVSVTGFHENGLSVNNNSGSVTVNVTGGSFANNNATDGQAGLLLQSSDSAGLIANVTGTVFDNLEGGAVLYIADGTAAHDLNVTGITSSNPGGADNFPFNAIVTVVGRDQNTVPFDVNSNTFNELIGDGVVVVGDGNMQGRVNTNIMDGDVASVSADPNAFGIGDGVRFDMDGVFGDLVNSANFVWTVLASGNTIAVGEAADAEGDDGIQLLSRDHVGTFNVNLRNNNMSHAFSEGVRFFAGERGTPVLGDTTNLVEVSNNAHTNTGVGTGELDMVMRTTDTAVACFDMTANSRAATPLEIDLQETETSVQNVVQSSSADVAASNGGATVAVSANPVTFSQSCNPPDPSNP